MVVAQVYAGPMMPRLQEYIPANSGRHVIHTGGEHASCPQLPVQNQE
ncbi:hypothetical protein [Allocatelliglobosispora scoriae]|nr:hypothetical protein [Allocatelliglobosispora scoriae]